MPNEYKSATQRAPPLVPRALAVSPQRPPLQICSALPLLLEACLEALPLRPCFRTALKLKWQAAHARIQQGCCT
eukprot:1159999-Pelagomonas_calceolata.AAC.6